MIPNNMLLSSGVLAMADSDNVQKQANSHPLHGNILIYPATETYWNIFT
jgi:hypothetical protein